MQWHIINKILNWLVVEIIDITLNMHLARQISNMLEVLAVSFST